MSRILFPLIAVAALAGLGCDDKKARFAAVGDAAPAGPAARKEAAGNAAADGQPAKAGASPTDRKVIMNVRMELTVDDVEATGRKVTELVKEAKGYVVKSDESGAVGTHRRATWSVRVPAQALDTVTEALRGLGEVTRRNADTKDVTEEFYDTEARLKHWKGEEDALLKIMKEKAQSPEDILKFRAQITPIRENIDRMEARMTTIRLLTEMSTIDLTLQDREKLPEATPASKPTTSVGRTFAASVETLQNFGHDVLIVCVGLAPWLPLILVAFVVLRWAFRRLTRPRPRRAPPQLPAANAE